MVWNKSVVLENCQKNWRVQLQGNFRANIKWNIDNFLKLMKNASYTSTTNNLQKCFQSQSVFTLDVYLFEVSACRIDDAFAVRTILFVVDWVSIERLFALFWGRPAQSDESTGHNSSLQLQWGRGRVPEGIVILAYKGYHKS